MLKRGRTLLAININIIMVILVLALMYGCPKSPTEPSYSGPNPALGFEISFFWGPKRDSRPGYWVGSIVSYKGAESGIESAYVKAGDGRCKDWHRVGGTSTVITGPSNIYDGGSCDFNKNGTYTYEVYLKDNNKRDSNLLSTTITVTGLAQ